MEEQQRKFEGVWIPKELWLSTELTLQEKVMIVEINSLDNKDGCYASNDYFAKFFNLSKARVSQIINTLSKKEIIDIQYIYKGKEVDKRIIHINQDNLIGIKYPKEGIKYPKCNNIVNNINTIDNNKLLSIDNVENKQISKKDLILKENIKCIIDYLNQSIGSNYKYNTKGTVSLIKARFNEGYKLDDFYDVIDKKVAEWIGTDFEQYLRPATLFGNKFENYLNATIFKGKPKASYSSKPSFDNTINNGIKIHHITDEEFNKLSFEDKMKEMDKFDAVADMTDLQKEFHNKYCLARDENGNLLKF